MTECEQITGNRVFKVIFNELAVSLNPKINKDKSLLFV